MKTLLGVSFVAFVGLVVAAPESRAEEVRAQPGIVAATSPQVPVECIGAGSSDVMSRNHAIKNNTGHPIPKGTYVHWAASNKGTGELKLANELQPGQVVSVIEPGQTNGYSCTAFFYAGDADFTIKSIAWTSATTAQVTIGNANYWADAGASTVHVGSFKCIAQAVGGLDAAVPAIPKGGQTVVNVSLAKRGADYLQATANATSSVPETNKTNNTGKSVDFNSNPSCTPR